MPEEEKEALINIPPVGNFNNNRLYNDDMIYDIINTYRNVASKYLNLSAEELAASVFEKPKFSKKSKIIKDGVHIKFMELLLIIN